MNRLLIVLLFFISCTGLKKEELETAKITKVKVVPSKEVYSQYKWLTVYVIDSCEYVGYLKYSKSGVLSHKGNCKFCKKRNERK